MQLQDVRVGKSTVVEHADGGWALPGGGRTDDRLEAMGVAAEIDRLMPRSPVIEVPARVPCVVTRRPAKNASVLLSRT